MNNKSAPSTVVNNVSINTSVGSSKADAGNSSSDDKASNDKIKDEMEALTKQFTELSTKFEAFACCQKPFDLALGQYLESRFQQQQQQQLTKRL